MRTDPDRLLNQLVVAAITVFIVAVMLLIAAVIRQHWLQQRLAELTEDVQLSLESLEEATEGIQSELAAGQGEEGEAQIIDDLQGVAEALSDVGEQLDTIVDDDLAGGSEREPVVEPQPGATAALTEPDEPPSGRQDPVDQVFTIFAILVGLASIAMAILLAMAVRVEQQSSPIDGSRT